MGITGSAGEEAARQAALFTSGTGSLGSHRLMMGSGMRTHVGVSNEPGYSSSGRDFMTRGEDFVGLYGGVGRLGASLNREEGGSLGAATQATSNIIAARSGRASFMTFVGGDFRVHSMGRGEEAAAAAAAVAARGGVSHYEGTSLPLIGGGAAGAAARRGEEGEGFANVEASWPGAGPSVGSGTETQHEIAKEAIQGPSVEDSTNRIAAAHQLTLARLEAAGTAPPATRTTSASQGGGPVEHGVQLDEHHHHHLHHHEHQQREPMMRQSRSAAGSIACQDCGNQAKKDCPHRRCRTCCKSRGLECATHVKSTWVPVSRRRERQQAELMGGLHDQQHYKSLKFKRTRTLSLVGVGGDPAAGVAPSHTSTSTGTPPRSSDINSAAALPQEGEFRGVLPPEVRMQAVFRCVRLTGITNGQDEYAYKTVVKIGGHIFKGILYDQGQDKDRFTPANMAELQLGGKSVHSGSALMDVTGLYGTGGSAILGGLH